MQVFERSVSVLLHIAMLPPSPCLKQQNKHTKKGFRVVPTALKWPHGERGGEQAGVKVKSDKTVPDCLHVCWVFIAETLLFYTTKTDDTTRTQKKTVIRQSVQLLLRPQLTGSRVLSYTRPFTHSLIAPFIHPFTL